jgi:hypothetical protein
MDINEIKTTFARMDSSMFNQSHCFVKVVSAWMQNVP